MTLLLSRLTEQVKAMGAVRIVFDAIDVLLSMMDHRLAERLELYRVRDWLKEQHMTGIITARVVGEKLCANLQYNLLQYMSDCVLSLQASSRSVSPYASSA